MYSVIVLGDMLHFHIILSSACEVGLTFLIINFLFYYFILFMIFFFYFACKGGVFINRLNQVIYLYNEVKKIFLIVFVSDSVFQYVSGKFTDTHYPLMPLQMQHSDCKPLLLQLLHEIRTLLAFFVSRKSLSLQSVAFSHSAKHSLETYQMVDWSTTT